MATMSRGSFKFYKLFHTCKNITDASHVQNPMFVVPVRTSKHWNPKWKWLRGQKVAPVDLIDFHAKNYKEKVRNELKKLGLPPPRFWNQRPITIMSTSEIIDPYVPPEGDGKVSFLSKKGAAELATSLNKKKNSMLAIRKIKLYEENFDVKTFPQQAHDLYIKAHTVLMEKDPEKLSEFVTDKALGDMLLGINRETLSWKFIKSLEPAVVVHARVTSVIKNDNLFAQLTVRFHTKQSLAIYDRFGRLFYGNENLAKDVLEYAVFEKHIVNTNGVWKLHGKIIPEWMGQSELPARTYRIENLDEEEEEDDFEEEEEEEEEKAKEKEEEEEKEKEEKEKIEKQQK